MLPIGQNGIYARAKSVVKDRIGGYTGQDQYEIKMKGKYDPIQKVYGTPRMFSKGKDNSPLKIAL